MMIRRGIYLACVLLLSLGMFNACELLEDCGTCEMVTEYDDGTVERTAPQLLCGDDLNEKLDYYEETPDGRTIWYECE